MSTIQVPKGPAVTIVGAGRDATTLIGGTAGLTLLAVRPDHSVVECLTLDTHMHNGGAAFLTGANFVTLQHSRALGGTQMWAVRFAGGSATATPTAPTYKTGNLVDDLILHDYAPGQDDGLDFSFQENGSISNVQHIGSRLGLYVNRNITVTNYSFTPEPSLTGGTYGWFITTPSQHITITNFVSSGQGGHIGASPPGTSRISSDITIDGENMIGVGKFRLFVGDVTSLNIQNSSLQIVQLAPNLQMQGTIHNSTYRTLDRTPAPNATLTFTTV